MIILYSHNTVVGGSNQIDTGARGAPRACDSSLAPSNGSTEGPSLLCSSRAHLLEHWCRICEGTSAPMWDRHHRWGPCLGSSTAVLQDRTSAGWEVGSFTFCRAPSPTDSHTWLIFHLPVCQRSIWWPTNSPKSKFTKRLFAELLRISLTF